MSSPFLNFMKKRKYTIDKATGLYKNRVMHFKNQPLQENVIGKCTNPVHIGNMSRKMVLQHQCLKKDCPYFKKYADNPYWTRKSIAKVERDIKKLAESVVDECIKRKQAWFVVDGKVITISKRKSRLENYKEVAGLLKRTTCKEIRFSRD